MIPEISGDPITRAEYELWLAILEAERLKELADLDDQCRVWAAQDAGPAAGETACTHSIDCGCRDCEAIDWYALGRALVARRYPTTDEDQDTNWGDIPF